MKITMPVIKGLDKLKTCQLTLARRKEDGQIFTAILVGDEVLYINSSTLMYSDYDYFLGENEIIRPYEKGETLSITV
jgi:hypothetical protein